MASPSRARQGFCSFTLWELIELEHLFNMFRRDIYNELITCKPAIFHRYVRLPEGTGVDGILMSIHNYFAQALYAKAKAIYAEKAIISVFFFSRSWIS